jgi:predicted NAD-dependent protein-ADP-ribosyltransferase YbiA (DUF1768 family)
MVAVASEAMRTAAQRRWEDPEYRERMAAARAPRVAAAAAERASRWAWQREEQRRRTAFREWFKSDEGFASVYLLALEPGWLEQEFPAWRAEIDA